MDSNERAKILREYENLKRKLHELNVQTATVKRRLIDLEMQLPLDAYSRPDDVLPKDK